MDKLQRMAKRIRWQVGSKSRVLRQRIIGEPVGAADVHWMFIATLPNSGSTAFAMLLSSAPRAVTLHKTGEGQWLAPDMSRDGRRWDPAYKLDYPRIRAVWLDAVAKTGVKPCLVVEKSPPNLCRMAAIVRLFSDMDPKLALFTRDPYAVCASWAGRYSRADIVREWYPDMARLLDTDAALYRTLGRMYGERAEMMIGLRDAAALTVSYEELTEHPASVAERLEAVFPLLAGLNLGSSLRVKDYAPQPLKNMNESQIQSLSPDQLRWITEGLAPSASAITSLGYDLRNH